MRQMKYSPSDQQKLIALGNKVRALREQRSWSQEKLAELTNLHRTYIGSLERGERNVAYLNLIKISSAFGITTAELLA